jgi:hypothetical protein
MNNDIIKQIQQEYRIADDGSVTVSIRGAARLCGVTEQALSKQFSTGSAGDKLKTSKLIEMLMQYGFEGDNLKQFASFGIPDTALAIVIQYYAMFAGRYCTEQAKLALAAFAAIGIRTWIQAEAGWSQATTSPRRHKQIPPGWSPEVWQQLEPHDREYHSETSDEREERRYWDIRDIRNWFRRQGGF